MSRHLSSIEKEKARIEQDKLQVFIGQLLKEEDNRYCADCDAKGAYSYNFIRTVGVPHQFNPTDGCSVTKVKSVNLDSWTPEQVQSMRVKGNSVGRAVYEANLPENFRRPQSDQAMEAFIRSKYEQKRYMMKDWIPPKVNISDLPLADAASIDSSASRTSSRVSRDSNHVQSSAAQLSIPKPESADGAASSGQKSPKTGRSRKSSSSKPQVSPKASAALSNDLADLSFGVAPQQNGCAPAATPNHAQADLFDVFGDFASAAPIAHNSTAHAQGNPPVVASNADLLGGVRVVSPVFGGTAAAANGGAFNAFDGLSGEPLAAADADINLLGSDKKTKDDILKLYNHNSHSSSINPVFQTAPSAVPVGAMFNQGNPFGVAQPLASNGLAYHQPTHFSAATSATISGVGGMGYNAAPFAGVPSAMSAGSNPFGAVAAAGFGGPSQSQHLQQIQSQLANIKIQQSHNPATTTLSTNLWQ